MTRLLTAAALVALTAGTADAGPIRDRLKARFAPSPCASGQCQPAVAFPSAPPVAAAPVTPAAYTLPAATCVNGSCAAAPVTVFRRR